MENRIGTCSICGGAVVMPNMMVNPVPHCTGCGAYARNPHGPVIPMERPKEQPIKRDAVMHFLHSKSGITE